MAGGFLVAALDEVKRKCKNDKKFELFKKYGIYGIEAASKEYFHKPASKLSVREAALIAAIFPNPIKWHPVYPSPFVQRKASRITHFITRLKLEDF